MKRLLTLLALVLCSCAETFVGEEIARPNNANLPDLTASFDDEEATRTYIEEGKYLRWNEDDRLTAFYGNTLNRQYKFNGATGDNSGTFSLVPSGELGTGNTLDAIYAIYPYDENASITDSGVISLTLPATQSYAENSFGRGANTMLAVTENLEDTFLSFKNACGYLKLKLYNAEGSTIKGIEVNGKKGERLAGAATATIAFGEAPMLAMADDATTSVTLDCGEGVALGRTAEEATELWVVLPATTFAEGLTITATDAEGKVFKKSTTKEVVIERNAIQPMAALVAEFNELTQPNNEIWYTSTDGEIVNPYYANRFGATMVSNTYENGKGVIRCDGAITKIDVEAFMGCSRFASMSLPEGVWTINEDAFSGCSNLRKITLPKSLRCISYAAMRTCGVSEIHISDLEAYCNIDFLDKSLSTSYDLFVNGELLTHLIFPESNNIVGYRNFIGCRSLTDVYIHDNVSCIESYAFNQCVNISNLYIGNNVKKIYPSSFLGCSSLSEVTIPESVQEIGNSVFRLCSNLKSVFCKPLTPPVAFDWSDSDDFEWRTFEDIATDAVIYVPAESVDLYKSASGWSDYADIIVAYDFEKGEVVPDVPKPANDEIWYTNGSTTQATTPYETSAFSVNIVSNTYDTAKECWVIKFDGEVTTIGNQAFDWCNSLTSVTIPDSVTTIGERAFARCNSLQEFNGKFVSEDGRCFIIDGTLNSFAPAGLTEYTIPNSVTTIGDSAFWGCNSLTSVTIPDSVTSIGNSAFYFCDSLTSVAIGNSVTSIGDYAFYYCSSLTSVTIPDSVTEIGVSVFEVCSSLTSVTIPNSVTTIGNSAFYFCDSLTSVTIPDSVTTIGSYAFQYCRSLTSVTIPDSVTTIGENAFAYCSNLTSVTIPDSVTTIGENVFCGCSNLTSVTIPDSVTSIGEWAFALCDSLTSVTIGDSVTSIGDMAFYSCDSLTSITISDSVTTIGWGAFSGCSILTSVTIPDSVTTIGDRAFEYCTSLTSITIPDSATTIGGYAFQYCRSLTSVTIPDSVTKIGWGAFQYCDSLTSVTIPDSVTTIYSSAFSGCTSLTSVYCKAVTPPTGGSNMFGNNASGRKIYVPTESVEAYKSTSYWSDYADAIAGYNFKFTCVQSYLFGTFGICLVC